MSEERQYLNPNFNNYGSNTEMDPNRYERMGSKDTTGEKLPQYIAALSATLGALAAGTVLGFTSPTEKEYTKNKVDLSFIVTDADFKWIGSLAPLGCLIMCIPVGFIMDYIGRKLTMLMMVIVFTVGWALIIWPQNVAMIMAGRFLTGMASGTFCIAAPLYTSEIAQKEIRGSLGSYFQLMITIGILIAYVLGYFINPTNLAIVCGVIPFVFGATFVFMPESPIYALKKNDEVKARKCLQWLRGNSYNIDDEINEMKEALDEDKRNPVSAIAVLKTMAAKKALMISFGLMLFQQFSGVNAVIFYTSSIFESAGSSLDSKVASIIVGAMQVIATFVSSLVIDRLGRRILLMLSATVMTLCAFLLGLFLSLSDRKLVDKNIIQAIGFLPILALSLFIIVFSLGFGPIPWMISSEVYPREIKTIASSGAGTFNWFLAFLVTLFFPDVKESIGLDVTFYIFMGILAVGSIFVFFIVPETKGKTLEQIQRELNGGTTPRPTGIVNQGYTT